MNHWTPTTIRMDTPVGGDERIGHLLAARLKENVTPRAVIVGFPVDQGVRRRGGRSGAAEAPEEIRRHLYELSPDGKNPAHQQLVEQVADLGNVAISGDVEQDQQLLGLLLAQHLAVKTIPILLGGGQETSYGHFLGYVQARRDVAILSWDARPDVLAAPNGLGHSRSPFRQALLHPSQACRQFVVAGLAPHLCPPTYLDFISNQSGRYYWRDSLSPAQVDEIHAGLEGNVMVSFDISALDQSRAPGVSDPTAGGLDIDTWMAAAYAAGRSPHVSSFDLVECNPHFDRSGDTARLAALTVWRFLAGVADRFR